MARCPDRIESWRGQAAEGLASAWIPDQALPVQMDPIGATRSAIPEMVDLGRCVKDHYAGILAGIRSGITNALAEGLNNKIRMAFHRAFGFKAPAYRDTMIFRVTGDLPISREMPITHSK